MKWKTVNGKLILKGKWVLDYHQENDVLYAYVNKPRKTCGIDLNNGVTVGMTKNKIAAFTITNFVYKMLKSEESK
jgi:hypothetical protein